MVGLQATGEALTAATADVSTWKDTASTSAKALAANVDDDDEDEDEEEEAKMGMLKN